MHERITHVGGRNPDGKAWLLPIRDAVAGVKNGTYSFFTTGGGRIVDVIVARTPSGYEYLKTVADGAEPNNLLALSSCPV